MASTITPKNRRAFFPANAPVTTNTAISKVYEDVAHARTVKATPAL
jgi:hypothetical protein